MRLQKSKGFTLIELLVVIAIIAILATGAVTVYTAQLAKARDAANISNLAQLNSANSTFYADSARYALADSKANFDTDLKGKYLQSVPNPAGTNKYFYGVDTANGAGTPSKFEFEVVLEDSSNTARMANDGGNQAGQYEVGTDLTLITGAAGSEATAASGSDQLLKWGSDGVGVSGDL